MVVLGIVLLIVGGVFLWPSIRRRDPPSDGRGLEVSGSSPGPGEEHCDLPPEQGPGLCPGPRHRVGLSRALTVGDSVGDAADAVLLLALALRGGHSVADSLDVVARLCRGRVRDDLRSVSAAHRWGMTEAEAWAAVGPDWEPAATAWIAASRAGVAPSDLLINAANRMHDAHDEAVAARVQRAAVLLVLPLGGLFLPGFVATTIVPLVLHLLQRSAA